MLDFTRLAIWTLSHLLRGARLHQAGLAALHQRRWDDAELFFSAGALRYRREIEVQALARLRVHQLMARAFASADAADHVRCLEVERRLCQIDRIEALSPPFELVDAHSLLARWFDELPARSAEPEQGPLELPLGRAA